MSENEKSNAKETTANNELEEKVKGIIEQIRPYIQMDGGDVQFVNIKDNVVYLQLLGACAHCPGSIMTLKMGIERKVIEQCPQIVSVEAV